MYPDGQHVAAGPQRGGDIEFLHQPATFADADLDAVEPDPVHGFDAVEAQQHPFGRPAGVLEGPAVVGGGVLVRDVRDINGEGKLDVGVNRVAVRPSPAEWKVGNTQCDGTAITSQVLSSMSGSAKVSSSRWWLLCNLNRQLPFRLSDGASVATQARGGVRVPDPGVKSST